MRVLNLLLPILLIIGIVSCSSNVYYCNSNDPNNYCKDVIITQKEIGNWNQGNRGGAEYTQWEVTLENKLDFSLTQFYILRDYTLKIRDRKSIWNVQEIESTNNLILPTYQNSIGSKSNWIFGFILQDSEPANLTLEAISF
ncbi:cellulose-binding domain-containing protein [Dictyostelium discoideum AX4]|uniref:Cellulose-binding domain-containing protein n=1 Tax=Dictyostelium discoideum TaxID=44689 RepID=Q54PW1_DICDI|nr:cellulose-binding domain-containing protein [Dictyostelium discoideum AX4]EAL65340.1 cellulose-binding domain-containing protein [Dictyostelium discoideum AX4]|eukprot:XP_638684.1 cellulose-binding domain-containing protein [Dictyostelium discoideum AX4]